MPVPTPPVARPQHILWARRKAGASAGLAECPPAVRGGDVAPCPLTRKIATPCSNGIGYFHTKTDKELLELDVGLWFAPEFAGTRFPTLVETVRTVEELGMGIDIEVRPAVPHNLHHLCAALGQRAITHPASARGLAVVGAHPAPLIVWAVTLQ